jgi:hypothetical protein
LVIVGVGAAIYFSAREQLAVRNVETVRGLVGSEKQPFFQDPRVQAALRRNGLDVQVQKAGSREIATSFDLSEYDFGFPAGVPAAEKLRREQNISTSYNVFFTPMAIATWRPIAELLSEQGIAQDRGGYYTVDMHDLQDLMASGIRWEELPDNNEFPVGRSVLITSTDVRTSNSAAMYLALASYVANADNIVESLADAQPFMATLSDLFLRQGFRPSSSLEPFEDYLVKGMGHSPMVMIYEAQFISQAALQDGSITPDMVLMYPEPTIFTKHVLIPFSENGQRLGEALMNDPELQQLAIEYGFRNNNTAYFRQFVADHNVTIPDQIIDVIEPPSYEVLEGMIQQIEAQYDNQ